MNENKSMQRILIVDDAPRNISLLGELLKDKYNIQVANNGEKAIRIAQEDTQLDLVLLDVMMPKMDGYEVCERLKKDERTRKIPIIFITGKDREQDEIKGFELGAVDYITKPFNPVIVRARVKTHLELKRYRDFLEDMSLIDGLTGIPNRRKFDEYYETTWNLAIREEHYHSILMLDIDLFKLYNDHYGHQAGDECIVKIAQALQGMVKRKTDLVARYGGEEFVCILPDTPKEDAFELAEMLRLGIEALNIEHATSTVSKCVTVSVGVSTIRPINGMVDQGLIKAADDALYCSKEKGRNRVTHFDTLETTSS